ncbi:MULTISPECIES: alpha/beta hydrolase [unclassified Carboxylicivirga]|uniref:alpha/beta hydrolase n=1 Tax=Carboxylicivirga TaxID=1628153 RepID=UPI003D34DD21
MYRKHILTFLISVITYTYSYSQKKILYKQIDSTKLFMEVYHPELIDTTKQYPAMVFFFGGGWINGSIKQFEPHANHFSRRGMICFLVDYRVNERQQTSPFESLKDAKSAIRYIKEQADKFHIDTSKIVAAGGSAGGHLAAATALIDSYNENTDNMLVSCVPNALVLFNPVFDNGPGGYGYDRIGAAYKEFSPLHNLKKGAPPTIVLLGTNDRLIPVETAKYYGKVMKKVGSKFDLKLHEGEGHGFFNYKNFEYYKKTLIEADKFLVSLGYLKAEPIIKIE